MKNAVTYREAIRAALAEEMRRDRNVVLIGEDVGKYGGCFKVTQGLWDEFGADQILETPVSEEGFTGLAVGAAMMGLRPVVEIMYGDFSTLASDPLINHAAKTRFMSAGQLGCPMVYRAPSGSGTGHGAQHTQSLESMFTNVPGLKIVAPSFPRDAKALLKAAIRDDDPVLYFEHKLLYSTLGPVGDENDVAEIGKADIKHAGNDITLISYSHAVHTCLEAADLLAVEGIDTEVVDICSLRPLDVPTILSSVRKTGRAVVVHDAPTFGGFGGELVASIVGDPKTFSCLKAPIRRVCGKELPVPFNEELEKRIIPSVEDVVEAVKILIG
ncbi:MAG: alpha-ketoacid dehydrogenase subunit beta [Sphaerochaetaceae bacterium]|nr:alpha-ketoacid dehydrogenase subunit beta [Sphaerochaetaceae bacterium]